MQAAELSRWTRYEDLPERLTVDEYCKAAGVCRATGYDHARQGIVPTVRVPKPQKQRGRLHHQAPLSSVPAFHACPLRG
jgi:hypothetical protein